MISDVKRQNNWHIFISRFAKNKLALLGTFIITFFACLAILGYLITPDSSPMANQMTIQLAAQKPGFNVTLLKVRKNQPSSSNSFLSELWLGKEDQYSYIPISSSSFKDQYIVITEYLDEDNSGPERQLSMLDVVYPLPQELSLKKDNEQLSFTSAEGELITTTVKELQSIVKDQHIIQRTYWLGTDRFGRDMLSRMIIGARVSLAVGLVAVLISLLIGLTAGLVAGYYRGWVDQVIMWVINVVWSLPTLLMVIALTIALGKGFWQVFVAVGLTMWVEVARMVRGQVFSIREKEYVEAAKALGYNDFRIIVKHILPNVAAPLIVISSANFAAAILLEAGLSFLGLGVQPPTPSWGMMIKEHFGYIILDAAYLAIIPGLAIMLLVMAFNFLGNGLRDALDVKLK